MDKGLILILLILTGFHLNAQEERWTYQKVDQYSYELYQQQNWPQLNKYAKKAGQKGFDFYYLRLRRAIALYEMGNYRKSTEIFYALFHNDSSNQLIHEYLYYSLLFVNNKQEAVLVSKQMDQSLREKLNADHSGYHLMSIGAETKVNSFSDQMVHYNATDILKLKDRQQLNYYNLSLSHSLGGNWGLSTAFTHMQGVNNKWDTDVFNDSIQQNLAQTQIFIAISKALKKRWNLSASFQFIRGFEKDVALSEEDQVLPDSVFKKGSFSALAGSVKMVRSFGCWDVGISAGFSNMNSTLQYSPAMHLNYFPMGNLNLYFLQRMGYHLNQENQENGEGFYFQQKIGIRITDFLWVEPFWFYGKVRNFSDGDLFILYNSNDYIKSWYGMHIHIPLAKNSLKFYMIYQGYNMQSVYQLNLSEQQNNYFNHSFLGGLSWTF